MSQFLKTKEIKCKNSFIEFVKKECVLVIALTLAILSSIFSIPNLDSFFCIFTFSSKILFSSTLYYTYFV